MAARRGTVQSGDMKPNHAVLRSAATFFVVVFTSSLTIASSNAGSRIGFRDDNGITGGAIAARHGADDPANHNLGDDRGRHSGRGMSGRNGADDPANHNLGD